MKNAKNLHLVLKKKLKLHLFIFGKRKVRNNNFCKKNPTIKEYKSFLINLSTLGQILITPVEIEFIPPKFIGKSV